MIDLEALEEATEPGHYFVQLCEYPAANKRARAYQIYRLDERHGWWERMGGARKEAIIFGWHGPLRLEDMETFDDPTETGYYAVWLQPWPGKHAAPNFKEFRVCIWRRGAWHDQYGWAKQHGNVLGWIGPFPMLPIEVPWVKQNEKEEAEDIGL